MAAQGIDSWGEFWRAIERLQSSLSKSKAVNVNSDLVREEARTLVQRYFRETRPELMTLGFNAEELESLDSPAQQILRLANGRSRRASYRSAIRNLRSGRSGIEPERELRIGHAAAPNAGATAPSDVERAIHSTLVRMVPSAALSYEQALLDLKGPSRVSYRGSAVELREALREVLDHLAPDKDVTAVAGFKLEKDARRPTMKQKARFILKARGAPSGNISASQDAVVRVDDAAASLARSVYTRGSISTHIPTTREEVLTLKMYVETVLAELLQIHAASAPDA